MKTTNERTFTATLFALGGALLIPCVASAQGAPSGHWTNTVSSVSNLVWDITAAYNITNIDSSIQDRADVRYVAPADVNGTGKVSGMGATTVSIEYDDPNVGWTTAPLFTGAYKVSGTIAANKGIARGFFSSSVAGIANMSGDRKVASSDRIQFVIDSMAGTCVGTHKVTASAAGLGAAAEMDTFQKTMTDIMPGNGSWTLTMDLSSTNTSTKVWGTATVTLVTGRTFQYLVKGVYKATTQQTLLVLSGTDTSKGSVLQVTLNGNNVAVIKGKICGQIVNVLL